MSIDKAVDSGILDSGLTTIADAIRAKGGTDAQLSFPSGMEQAIYDIPSGAILQSKTLTLGATSPQTLGPDSGFDGLSSVPVVLDSNVIKAENIAKDIVMLGITGTHEGGGEDTPEAEEKDVNFYGLNAKRLYSYTLEEAQVLSMLPSLPTDSFCGIPMTYDWGTSLATINALTSSDIPYNVCVSSIPTDGKTHIHIRLEDGRLSPTLGIGINGSIDIDWGDGTTHGTISGDDASSPKYLQHTYAIKGEYDIAFAVTGRAGIYTSSTSGCKLISDNSTSLSGNYKYLSCVQYIAVGDNVFLMENADYSFYNLHSLSRITIPRSAFSDVSSLNNLFDTCRSLECFAFPTKIPDGSQQIFNLCLALKNVAVSSADGSTTSFPEYAFNENSALEEISIPKGYTKIGQSAFYNCYALRKVTLNSSISEIQSSAFYKCYSISNIIIPGTVTTIGANSFYYCYSLGYIKFESTTPPTVSASNAFRNLPTTCKILVPAGSLAAYTSATNYPSASSYTYVEY